MPIIAFRETHHMQLRNKHEMHRGDGVDVVESDHLIILVQLVARNRAGDDLAEDAVTHLFTPCAQLSLPARTIPRAAPARSIRHSDEVQPAPTSPWYETTGQQFRTQSDRGRHPWRQGWF